MKTFLPRFTKHLFTLISFALMTHFSAFATDLIISGITSPADANGTYVPNGTLNGQDSWKHETLNYYIYYDQYSGDGNYYWNIDVDTNDENLALFYTEPNPPSDSPINASSWSADSGTGSPFIATASANPEMNLKGNTINVVSGNTTTSFNDHTNFGSADISGGTQVRTFTIENQGGGDLNITGVSITGANASDFSVTTSPSSPVSSLGSTTFNITFNPSAEGYHYANVSIANNDSDENPYTFNIRGRGFVPGDLVVSGITTPADANGTYIHQGVINNFEYWKHETNSYYLFNDEYSGAQYWNLDANLDDNDNDYLFFLVSEQGTPAGLTSWDKNTSITVVGDPVITEATPVPNIDVKGNAVSIADEDITPTYSDHTSFNSVEVSSGYRTRTYTIKNTGGAQLDISSVNITGTHSVDFSVSSMPALAIAGYDSTTFDITFDPTADGIREAEISIASNDADENPYNFSINGHGMIPENIIVSGITTPSAANGIYTYQGIMFEYPYWMNASGYYIYNDIWTDNQRYWEIDNDIDDATALFFSNNFDDDPSPLNVTDWGEDTGIGTPNLTSQPGFSIDDPSVAEGNSGTTNLSFTVSLSMGAPVGGASVDYATSDGTAIAGTDYTSASGTLTFVAGETSKTVNVTAMGDQIMEADETVILTLSNPTGTNVGLSDATGTGTINNDDAAAVTIADVNGNEDNGAITLTATLDYAVQGGFNVDVSTADGTATTADNDYTAVSGQTLTFAGTAGETQTFTITPGADTKLETSEMVTVSQSNLAATALAVNITDNATVTINNDDAAAVTIADVSGNEDDGAIIVTATLDHAVQSGFIVDVSTADGTATTADNDYTAVSAQTLTFVGTAGETQTFTVTPTFDTKLEADETVLISQYNLAGTTLAVNISDAATVTINNDDAAAVTIADISGNEDNGAITVTTTLDHAVQGGFTVDVSTADGTATTANNDYTAVSGQTLTFLGTVGETQTFTVTPTNDTDYENNETLSVSLSNLVATPLAVDITDGATITIINDDYPPLEAKFNLNPSTGCTLPHTVFFTDQSTYPDTWSWDFGDGNTSTAQNPIHSYTTVGIFTISLIVTDTMFGISDTAYAEIATGDQQAPIIVCPGTQTVYSDANCQGEVDDYTSLANASDFCNPNPVVTQSPAQGTLFSDSIEVTLYASDATGNIDSCSFKVVALDTINPQSVCQDISVYLDENGLASLMPGDVDNGSSDNCGIDSMWLDKYDFNCSELGPNNVTLYLNDDSGNIDSCTAIITVVDSINPIVMCNDITVNLDQSGNASITAAQLDGGSTDNCSIGTMWLDKYDFTNADLGNNLVTFYVSDASGNTDSCTATVTIGDDIAPDVKCNPITIYMDENGEYPLTDADVISLSNGTTDNVTAPDDLNIYALAGSNVFNCNSNGHQIVVQVFAIDEAGNRGSCNTLINVLDTFPLMVNPIDDVEVMVGAASCDTTVSISYPELTTTNKCAEFAQISGLGSDGDFPIGTTEEKWLLTNTQGDSLEFSFFVTVAADNLPPTLDPIADLDTTASVAELTIPLSGISSGDDCSSMDITITASGVNSEVVSGIAVNYTSPDTEGTLTLTIPTGASGSDTITVTVEDSEGELVTQTFMVAVDYINQTPMILNAPEDQEVFAGDEIKIPFNDSIFIDHDGDSLLIEITLADNSELPDWMDVMDDTIYITPAISDTGCFDIVVTATDPSMASVSDTFTVCVKGYPVGVGDITISDLNLNMYPNPSKGIVTLQFDAAVTSDIELLVSDITGKRVLQKTFMPGQQINFNLSDQVSGMYLVNVLLDDKVYTRKLILNKE